MTDGTLLSLALMVSVGGMAAFALTIEAHWRQLLGARARTRRAIGSLRLLGAALLVVALLLCATADPVSMAVVVWTMLLTVSAATVAALLTLQAELARRRAGA